MAFFSLLDEPVVRERVMRFTVEQYQSLGEAGLVGTDVELLEGIIVKKMSKSPLHVFTTGSLITRLRPLESSGWLIRQEQPITHLNSEPEPDISVVPGRLEDYFDAHPKTANLVIKVAISSVDFDHGKRAIYASAEVPEYWIVMPEERKVKVYTQPVGRDYNQVQSFAEPELITSSTLPSFQLGSVHDTF